MKRKLALALLCAVGLIGIAAVSTDTSFFQNISSSGWLSLSGQTNRLTVAGGSLKMDGSAIGGGTTSPWTNVSGVIKPAPGQTTNVLQFVSGLADNATNVALVVDTINEWNGGTAVSFRNAGNEQLSLRLFPDSNLVTIQNQDDYTTPTNRSVLEYSTSANPGANLTKSALSLISTSDDFDSTESVASLEATASNGTGKLTVSGTLDGFNTQPIITVTASAAPGSLSSVRIRGADDGTGATFFDFAPGVGATATPYKLDTKVSHSSGNLVEIKNNTTNKLTVAWDGATTVAQSASEPSAPSAGHFTLFGIDNGSGKMLAQMRFPSGASRTFATEVGGIPGVTDASSAAAGIVGEYMSSAVAFGSAVSLTSTVGNNVTSLSLTAGDWDVEGNVNFSLSGATVTDHSAGINTTTGTVPSDGTGLSSGLQTVAQTVVNSLTVPRKRINVSSTTTVYLVGKATFSAGTVSIYGSITARRMR